MNPTSTCQVAKYLHQVIQLSKTFNYRCYFIVLLFFPFSTTNCYVKLFPFLLYSFIVKAGQNCNKGIWFDLEMICNCVFWPLCKCFSYCLNSQPSLTKHNAWVNKTLRKARQTALQISPICESRHWFFCFCFFKTQEPLKNIFLARCFPYVLQLNYIVWDSWDLYFNGAHHVGKSYCEAHIFMQINICLGFLLCRC